MQCAIQYTLLLSCPQPQNVYCNQSLVCFKTSGTPSLLDPHRNTTQTSSSSPESWRSCGYHPTGSAPAPFQQIIDGVGVRVSQPKTQDVGLGTNWSIQETGTTPFSWWTETVLLGPCCWGHLVHTQGEGWGYLSWVPGPSLPWREGPDFLLQCSLRGREILAKPSDFFIYGSHYPF